MLDKQVITISFFQYEGLANRWWAFGQMGLAGTELAKVKGLEFSKMLGSGARNGFSIWPNFGVYGLLCCWSDAEHAESFFKNDALFTEFKHRSKQQWTIYMRNAMAHGEWEGSSPFRKGVEYDESAPVAVITRATIKTKYLLHFWRFVPNVSRSVDDKAGRLFSIGIGELPLVQQATFSLWENSHLMKEYAYKSKFHREVVQRTRALGWYKEELFARFLPYKSIGSWNGLSLPANTIASY